MLSFVVGAGTEVSNSGGCWCNRKKTSRAKIHWDSSSGIKSLLPHLQGEHPSFLYRKTAAPATKGPKGFRTGSSQRAMEFGKETKVRKERSKGTMRGKSGW